MFDAPDGVIIKNRSGGLLAGVCKNGGMAANVNPDTNHKYDDGGDKVVVAVAGAAAATTQRNKHNGFIGCLS